MLLTDNITKAKENYTKNLDFTILCRKNTMNTARFKQASNALVS